MNSLASRLPIVRLTATLILSFGSLAMMPTARAEPTVTAQPRQYPIAPVPFTQVTVDDDGFWGPRFETNQSVTIAYDFHKCEETGRIDNFAKAGGLMEGSFKGHRYDDSDVFKVIEGAAYSLATHPDPELDAYLDDLIAKIAAAQEEDGYLYTAHTAPKDKPVRNIGESRWSDVKRSHELYNVGHLYEAAVAHHAATGKRSLLDVAIKNADLVYRTFGPNEGQRRAVPGHQEIELALVRLAQATGDNKYLDLALFFLNERGHARDGRELGGTYRQDHRPVLEQEEGTGHAVRAMYQYAAMTDVAAILEDEAYREAVDRLWQDVAGTKTYITGGVGSTASGEAFGGAYELPNDTAYNETCAAIGNGLWNQRLFLLHGDAKYVDQLERILYNGFLSGVSLEGDKFFYPNVLEFDGDRSSKAGHGRRSPWFGTSCCPVNVVRFVPSIAGYVYATRGDENDENDENELFVNLFVDGTADIDLGGQPVRLTQETRYPWDGDVRITVEPQEARHFDLRVRIPGWARGEAFGTDLYEFADENPDEPITLTVNGEAVDVELEKGFARISRTWSPGDEVRLSLPMPVRRIVADERVEADRGRVALQRGPIVYCFEQPDNEANVLQIALPDDARFTSEWKPDLLGGVVVLHGKAVERARGKNGKPVAREVPVTAIPYYARAHRLEDDWGPAMSVWRPRDVEDVELPPVPTITNRVEASASHAFRNDSVDAIQDGIEPESSGDHSVPRMTFWPHKGTSEWLQYDLAEPATVGGSSVYWFDDTGRGQCRVPKSWSLQYRDENGNWQDVEGISDYGVARDQPSHVTFTPVETSAMRLNVQLQDDYSAGVIEWTLEEAE